MTEGLPRAYVQGEKIQLVELEFVGDTLKAIKVSFESHEPRDIDINGNSYLVNDLYHTLGGVFGPSMGETCLGKYITHRRPKPLARKGLTPVLPIPIPSERELEELELTPQDTAMLDRMNWSVIDEGLWWTDSIRLEYCYLTRQDWLDSPLGSLIAFKIWLEYISVDVLDELEDIHVEIEKRELERKRQWQEEQYREQVKRKAGEL